MSVAEVKTEREGLYEGMFLVDSSKFASDPEGTTTEILAILEKGGATVVAHRPWQDGKLAYEISGRRKGLHYLVCFRMPTSGMEIVTRQCHLSDLILRKLVIRHQEELFNAMVNAITGNSESEEESTEASEETPAAKTESDE